jgi:hypothetical protein
MSEGGYRPAIRHRVMGWLIIGVVLVLWASPASIVQGLHWARIGVVGSSDQPPDSPVTLTVSLPGSYGLSQSEQRAGWPQLNKPQPPQQVVLGKEFTAQFSRTTYCVTRLLWKPIPPPPIWLHVRFSDAPDEEYLVSRRDYEVRSHGVTMSKDQASWRLQLGAVERGPEDAQRVPSWLLHVRFIRQPPRGGNGDG